MAIVPASMNKLSLKLGGQNFNIGVYANPNSYKIEGKDSKTKIVRAADGTRFIATVNEKGQLVTKIINPNNPNDLSARAWGKGAQGDSVSLQGSAQDFLQDLIKSPPPVFANTVNWLAQQGTSIANSVSNFFNNATATFYAPGQGDISMQGGTKDRKGNTLIGHRVEDIVAKLKELKTQGLTKEQAIQKLQEGDHYIGVAADHTDPKNKYGTKISINSDKLTQEFKLNEIYEGLKFSDLHVKIVDTGGAFVGKGSGRLDIAMANIKTAYDIGKVDLSWKAIA
jgi:hypothetical protein